MASFAAADVIFRTLFSIPIEDEIASAVFHEFRNYQREQPILNVAAFVPGCRICDDRGRLVIGKCAEILPGQHRRL